MSQGRLVRPFGGPINGTPALPGSKSQTNRALLCAALARGTSHLSGVLFADDTEAMLEAVVSLGCEVEVDRQNARLEVTGVGGSLNFEGLAIDCRSSGTTSRFLLPVLAAGKGAVVVDGSDQLRSRPFGDQIHALRRLGATINELGGANELPIEVIANGLQGGTIEISGANSSQFVSGLMLAAPLLTGGLKIKLLDTPVSQPYLDLTIEVMRKFGIVIEKIDSSLYRIEEGQYRSADMTIEPDASAASYFFAAAAITQGKVRVEGLHRSSWQGDIQFVDVLEELGAQVKWGADWIEVEGDRLGGGTFDLKDFSDTAQTLAAVAAFSESDIEIMGVGFIREKETDRINAIVTELVKCGVEAVETSDGLIVKPNRWRLTGASIDTYDDHRMAMSMALLGLRVPKIEIRNSACVSKTFPDFFVALDNLRPAGGLEADVAAVVAIDGPAGSGKSTVAKALAAELDLPHFDTGAMYRAVAVAADRQGIDLSDAQAVTEVAKTAEIAIGERVVVDGLDATEEIRSSKANQLVSMVASNPEVRRILVPRQRQWAAELGGGVMEGRDIGTQVFPDAVFKVFLTADLRIRAERRFRESSGQTFDEVLNDLERRDYVDSTRDDSPLEVAPGAVIFNTSNLSIEDVIKELAEIFRLRMQG